MREHLLVVERMTKLVRQRYHIREGAGEIGQHAALPDGGNAAVKGTSDLPGTREEINPCLVEGALHHVMQLAVKSGKDLQQVVPCGFGREHGIALPDRGKHIPPRQCAIVSQISGFGSQVLPEHRQVLLHSRKQGVQCFPLHARSVECLIQRRRKAAQGALVDCLQLETVHGKGNRVADRFIAGDLRVVSVTADGRIRVIGEVAHVRQRNGLPTVKNLCRTGQAALQILPRIGAGKIHFGD